MKLDRKSCIVDALQSSVVNTVEGGHGWIRVSRRLNMFTIPQFKEPIHNQSQLHHDGKTGHKMLQTRIARHNIYLWETMMHNVWYQHGA